jgi:hypothetical protein
MHDDGPVTLDEMVKQYHGNTLPELLDVHLKTIRRKVLPQVLRGTFIEFEPDLIPQLDSFTDSYLENWLKPEVATTDLGELLQRTISDVKDMCIQNGISLDDKRQFDLFHVLVLKLALRTHSDPDIKEMMAIKSD